MDYRIIRSSLLSFCLFLIFSFFSLTNIAAQTFHADQNESSFISDSSLNGMRWRLVGPFRGGRALAASGISGSSTTFYFGAVDGGVWKTTNAGLTWKPISDGQVNPSIGALAISQSNPNVIYAGTGEADMRSDITYGNGIYKSTDGGESWKHIGLDNSRHIGKILIDPDNPQIVLAAALGSAYAPSYERGVFKTTNGGKTWKQVLIKNDSTGAIDLAWDTKDIKVVYASLWQAQRTPWSQYPPEEGSGSGLYKSTDEGSTWSEVSYKGLPDDSFGRIGISVVEGSNGQKVYALIQALHKGSGLYYSSNGGNSWQLMSDNVQITTRMWYFGRIFIDPQNPKIIYAPNRSVFKSTDGGKTFFAIKGQPGGDDYHYIWIDPTNDHHLIVASDQGTVISLDNGKTWSSWYNQPTAQFYHVTTDNQFPYRIYGAQQDAGTVSITSRSDYGIITFRDWYPVNAGESGYIAPDPKNPNIVYGGDTYGGLFRFIKTTGQTQNITPWLLSSFGEPISKQKYRFTWTSPIGFDYSNPPSLYFGAQVLLKSNNGGLSWSVVSPDLTGAEKTGNISNSPLTVENAAAKGMGVIYSFAFSKVHPGIIWAGTDDGFIQISKDNGKHWQNVTPKGLKPWSKISIIEASPFDAGTAYAAVIRHRLDDLSPYIYKTNDFGAHWKRINNGIPNGSFVRVVREDPFSKGLLYAGTETGVYFSFNDGVNWQPLQLNLPEVSIRDLDVHENDLVAATHGRSFWVLDDLTPLRQINNKSISSNVFLFKPEDAVRIRRTESHDTPLPPETPHGDNPPSGAIIDYYIKNEIDGSVVLKIFDDKGTLIRKYSSNEKYEPPKEQPYFDTSWLPVFKPLTKHLGLNRFVWDLHYPLVPSASYGYGQAVTGKGTVEEPQGPFVLPGNYRVELIADGKTYSQPLKVVMDPRVKVPPQQLTDQINLALEIWNSASDQFQLSNALDSLTKKLVSLKKNYSNEDLLSSIDILNHKIEKLKKSLGGIRIAGLESTVMSADREPTQPMKQAYNILDKKLLQAEQNWKSIKDTDLKKVNSILIAIGKQNLEIPNEKAEHFRLP